MWRGLLYVGRGGLLAFAVAALDIALWDLRGLRAGQPLWQVAGGTKRSIPAYGSGVDLPKPLDGLLRQVEGFLARGFPGVKVKVGRPDPTDDEQRVAAVRALIGDGVDLMIDANMGWSPDEALERGRRLAEHRPRWLEEPSPPEAVDGHARLARALPMPIAVGESLHSVDEFRRYVEAERGGRGPDRPGHQRRDHAGPGGAAPGGRGRPPDQLALHRRAVDAPALRQRQPDLRREARLRARSVPGAAPGRDRRRRASRPTSPGPGCASTGGRWRARRCEGTA